MFIDISTNPAKLDTNTRSLTIQQRHSVCLNQQESDMLTKLSLKYQQLKSQIEKNQHLNEVTHGIQKQKLRVGKEQDSEKDKMRQKIRQLREQCTRKEKELARIKQIFVDNVNQIKNTKLECKNLQNDIERKEKEQVLALEVKKEKTILNNQLQSYIKQKSNQLKDEIQKKLHLKQILLKTKEESLSLRSPNDLLQQIQTGQRDNACMQKIIKEMYGLDDI